MLRNCIVYRSTLDGVEGMISQHKGSPEKWSPVKGQMQQGTALKNAQLRDHDNNPIRVEEKVAWMSNKGLPESELPDDANTVRGSFAGMLLPSICSSHHSSYHTLDLLLLLQFLVPQSNILELRNHSEMFRILVSPVQVVTVFFYKRRNNKSGKMSTCM